MIFENGEKMTVSKNNNLIRVPAISVLVCIIAIPMWNTWGGLIPDNDAWNIVDIVQEFGDS
jgi:hypothetical protein